MDKNDAESLRQAKDGDVLPISDPHGIIMIPFERVNRKLDLEVAKTIGLDTAVLHDRVVLITPREWDEIRGIEHLTCEGNVACIPFQPSVDLNAAFAAAEKVGLFDEDGPEAFLCRHPAAEVTWKVWFGDESARDGGHAVYASTPALAICAAILRLKGEGE